MKARFFALAALVLGMVSCQQDFDAAPQVGGEVDFQLSVGAGEISATRATDGDTQEGYDSAYGAIDYLSEADWANKYDLRYSLEVYDKSDAGYAGATPIKDRMVQIVDKYQPVMFDLRLVPNRDYHFVVFADFVPQGASSKANTDVQRELGLRHNIGENLGQITIKEDAINDEIADAYFATKDIRIENSAAQDILLKRPYGKVRVIATDLDELNLNVNPGKVQVEYDAFHPSAFNAVTGEVAGEYKPCTYECEYAAISKEKGGLQDHFYNIGYDEMTTTNANGVERHKYMTLFTDYILAENQGQTAYHFTMTVWDQNDVVIKETHFNTDIPVERNMLTTVVGNVLTTATEINVSIDDNFATKYTLTMWDGSVKKPEVVGGAYAIYEAAELAWVAQQVNTKGNTFKGETFKLCKDIHLNGEAWTPIGANGKFEGTFDGQNNVIEGLFVNMTDKTPAGLFSKIFGAAVVKNVKVCHAEIYGHNMIGVIVGENTCADVINCHVENATVVATTLNDDLGSHVAGIVGYLSADGSKATVEGCSVKNVTITAFRDVAAIVGTATAGNNPTIKNCRAEGATITANQLPAYKEGDKDGNAGVIVGRIANASAIIEECTEGEGNIVKRFVNSTKELEYAVADAKDGETIYVDGEVVMPYFTGKALNFEGVQKSATIKQSPAAHNNAFYAGATLNFKGVTLVGEAYASNTQGYQKAVAETYEDCTFVNYIMFAGETTTVNNCTFTNVGQYFWTGTAKNITFNNCVFNAKERAIKVCTVGNNGERTATFNKCTFSAKTQVKAAIEVDGSKGSSYKVYINECTETGFAKGEFTGHSMFNVEGAENVELYLDGLKWVANGIFVDEDGNVCVYNAEGLEAAAAAAANGDTIKVIADIEGDVTVAQKADVEITIDGDGHDYKGVIVVDGKSATYTTAGLTIKNLNFNAETISADACIRLGDGTSATRYTCNVTVEECTFDVPGAVGVKSYTGGDKNLTISNCTATAKAHSMLQAKGIDGILVEGCTVNSKNGLNFNNSNNVVVDSSNVEVKGYAVRFGEGSVATGGAETYTIQNSTLKSSCDEEGDAVIVLRGTADKATLNLINTTIEGKPQIINNAAEAKVLVENEQVVTSAEALNAALANGGTITLGTNVEGTFLIRNKNVELIGVNGATITGRINISGQTEGNTVTFNNVAFNRNDTDSAAAWNTAYGSSKCLQYKAVVMIYGNSLTQVKFNGCKFYKNNGSHRGAITNTTCELIVDNCYFEGTSSAIYSQCNLSITNSTFNYTGTNNVIASINGCGDAGGKFIFKNNQSTGDKIFALSQFLSTTSFGNGTYHFDVDDSVEFDNYFFNTGRVTNKTFAEGSLTF